MYEPDFKALLAALDNLPADRLAQVHRFYADAAAAVAAKIEERRARERIEREARARFDALATVPHRYRELLAGGATADHAVDAIARELGSPRETILYHLDRHRRATARAARAERDRLIASLARRGWSNAEIAAQVQLSPSTVARIVAGAIRTAQLAPAKAARAAATARAARGSSRSPAGGRSTHQRRP
jgi:DNA-binding NarL/FixJ family response regulator